MTPAMFDHNHHNVLSSARGFVGAIRVKTRVSPGLVRRGFGGPPELFVL